MSAGLRAWLLRSRLFPEDFINDKKVGRTARNKLGKGAENQNGNLRWHLPLGVPPPPPLMAKFPDIFLPHFFSFALESYIYETDFTLQKYHF